MVVVMVMVVNMTRLSRRRSTSCTANRSTIRRISSAVRLLDFLSELGLEQGRGIVTTHRTCIHVYNHPRTCAPTHNAIHIYSLESASGHRLFELAADLFISKFPE